jgi:hypothetical protein
MNPQEALLQNPETQNLLKEMILEKADHLETLEKSHKQFMISGKYKGLIFKREFREIVSEEIGDGFEIKRVEKDLANMCYSLEKAQGNLKPNKKWEQDYENATQRVRIEDVVRHYTNQDNFRRNLHCPFHKDRKPSLKVYLKTNRFHCFSCGKHGSPIDFVMKHQNCDFKEAVQLLSYL